MKYDELSDFVVENYSGDFAEDIYCEVCSSCGEAGCCDPWESLKKHITSNNMACLHLPVIMRNIEFNYTAFDRIYDAIFKSETIDEVKIRCTNIFDELYDKIYKD